ncbi:pentapeptide repeat-containing protein [Streptomyces sp. NPDC002018]|uniref:pentapeptide repeat-containing protein n=1 Tax=Streptomyces sp. NPDC002018 TaxID=3364629 RepID=UPI0036926926
MEPFRACLTHLTPDQRDAYLAALTPGSPLDHRGTVVDGDLLRRLLDALRVPGTGISEIGTAQFDDAAFTGEARFESVAFIGDARFDSATFTGDAWFDFATFAGEARFISAVFNGEARFHSAAFTGVAWFPFVSFGRDARFHSAVFTDIAWFDLATFARDAWFVSTAFSADAWFDSASFSRHARFDSAAFARNARFPTAVFDRTSQLGPLMCAGELDLTSASFGSPVTIEAAARRVVCRRTRWSSTAGLRLRYAEVDFTEAVFEYPLSVAARPQPFALPQDGVMEEGALSGRPERVRMLSLRGVDAGHLVLTGLDLSVCRFAGTVHLDQLRLEGRTVFAPTPGGLHRRGWRLVRFTRRRTLAEEQYWQAARPAAVPGWAVARDGEEVEGPAVLEPVYRSLRKAFEDGKNEPGAADFYYGEMVMRRADEETPPAERWLLTVYWALSGYGLRATRALLWLLASITVTLVVMMLWGVPGDDPRPVSTGTVTGRQVELTTDTPDPVNPTGPLQERLSTERFERSLRVVVNSVIFRSSGQDLTTVGTYSEMTSRLVEPVLLGLAVLTVRGRIKR